MLESLRKHNYVLMCVIATVVILAFSFWLNPNKDLNSGVDVVTTVFGEELTRTDVESMSESIGIASALSNMGRDPNDRDFMSMFSDPLFQFSNEMPNMGGQFESTGNLADLDGPVNIALIRQEAKRLGISVEKEDLGKFVQSLKAFQTNKQFDSEKYEKFVTGGGLGDRSITEIKLFNAMRDVLLYQKLREVVGNDLPQSNPQIENTYASQHQITTVMTALLARAAHEDQKVTDEDVQKFYDAEKAKPLERTKAEKLVPGKVPDPTEIVDPALLTSEKRTIKYVRFTRPAEPTPPAAAPVAPVALNEEELKKLDEAARKAKEEEHKKLTEAHTAAMEAHTKALADHSAAITAYSESVKAWEKSVEAMSNDLADEERGSATFEEIATKYKQEVKTASFERAAAPEDLKGDTTLIEDVFTATSADGEVTTTAQDKKSYTIFLLAGVEKAAVKPLEQVKESLTARLKKEKVEASLKAAGASVRSNILEAMKGGKSFKEAASAQSLSASDALTFSAAKPLQGNTSAAQIKTAADKLNPGELSEPETVADGLLLVYVDKKELMDDPKMAEQKAAMKKEDSPFAGRTLLRDWFSRRRSEAAAVN